VTVKLPPSLTFILLPNVFFFAEFPPSFATLPHRSVVCQIYAIVVAFVSFLLVLFHYPPSVSNAQLFFLFVTLDNAFGPMRLNLLFSPFPGSFFFYAAPTPFLYSCTCPELCNRREFCFPKVLLLIGSFFSVCGRPSSPS